MPRVVLKDEWIEEVCWHITSDYRAASRRVSIFGDEGKRFVESLIVPVSPASKYKIDLIDEENLEDSNLASWVINGISENEFAVFNANGRQITPNYIPRPYGVIISGRNAVITKTRSVLLWSQSYPTDRAEYRIQSFQSTAGDGQLVITCQDRICEMSTRPQVEMTFKGTTLFHLDNADGIQFYTDIPQLSIDIGDSAVAGGIVLRIGSLSIDIDDFFEEGIAKIALVQYSKSIFTKFGIYSIRLYQNDHFIKQTEFTLVPEIPCNYDSFFSWPSRIDYSKELSFRFRKLQDIQMEFLGCSTGGDENEYIITCPPGAGSISVKLDYISDKSAFSSAFELPVRPFEYNIVDSNEESIGESSERITRTKRIGLTELIDKELWVFIRFFGNFKDGKYSLRVRSVNGIEQEESITLTQNGGVNKNLGIFHDTLKSCPLPAQIELNYEDSTDDPFPILIVSDTVKLSHRPTYAPSGHIGINIQDEERNLTISSFRNPDDSFRIIYEDSVVSKSGKTRGYKCPHLLDDGFYVVESDKSNTAFEFENEISTQLSNGRDTLYVSSRDRKSPIITISDWLDQLIRDILSAGPINDICSAKSYRMVDNLKKLQNTELEVFDFERIISLAYFIFDKCSNQKKASIEKCMKNISELILDDEKRINLIRTLVKLKCPEEITNLCIQHYKLALFTPGTSDAISLAEQLENKNIELSMLLRMGANDSLKNIFGKEKYRDLIGKESVKLLLNVPSAADSADVLREQKLFLREQPSRVKIQLNEDISGEMEPIVSSMLKVTHNKIVFDTSKKPDIGIYFDHIRYVDQYVNWYVSHSGNDWDLYSETKSAIVEVVKENCQMIMDAIDDLKRIPFSRKMTEQYDAALRARFRGNLFTNMGSAIPARFFYLQGLAAYLSKLPNEYRKYRWHVRVGNSFMEKALDIAPRISRRDIMMASTYIYLVLKEEHLCQ